MELLKDFGKVTGETQLTEPDYSTQRLKDVDFSVPATLGAQCNARHAKVLDMSDN